MRANVKKLFDAVAQQYDQQRRQLIPCFDEFYGMAVGHAEVDAAVESPSILDLGAGTGLLSAFLLQKFPQARLTLIDLSASMLEQARVRFAELKGAGRIKYIVGDYLDGAYGEAGGVGNEAYGGAGKVERASGAVAGELVRGPFDLVVSSLSIHHLEDADKARLFRRVHGWLKPGGRFVNADQASGSSPFFDAQYKRSWEAAIRGSELPEEAIASAIERRRLDRNASVPDQLRWLREAGFAEADCVYKYHEFAVFCACKG